MSVVFKWILKTKHEGFMVMEMPSLKPPLMRQVGITVVEKVKVFVADAGKVIIALSIVLWAMASFGPSERLKNAEQKILQRAQTETLSPEKTSDLLATAKLENSYIGILGHWIEPVIKPLGYDWKMGIAIITSFAAREVFVGSMATIYSVGQDFEDNSRLLDRMRNDFNEELGRPTYNVASGLSLMVFYVFAMQCLATFAVVQRETTSWKWPIIQVIYMGILAYLSAFITYHLFI
jgi:ferrous iron transport protein B